MIGKKQPIFVGLSGGVDSSVSAYRLINEGYTVIGVFVKTWQPDFLVCNWEAERLDAMRVAAQLKIPFLTCDAVDVYKHEVADYMIREYSEGRTPNPDVMCNKFVKFGSFLNYALEHGGSAVATGHYAHIEYRMGSYHLYRGADLQKDQSYFLWTLTQEQLSKVVFPVGRLSKSTVRTIAKKAKLPTYAKNDSQGICFLGQIDIKEFLSHYITVTKGDVINTRGDVIGTHDGALFYTLGQRHGFIIQTRDSQSIPHYVVEKNLLRNTITVSDTPTSMGGSIITLSGMNIIQDLPKECEAQFRYRQKPFPVRIKSVCGGSAELMVLDETIEIPSPGQSCVLYLGNECLGGGIIDRIAS